MGNTGESQMILDDLSYFPILMISVPLDLLALSVNYIVNYLVVNHIKKERRVQQCARIKVKNISCDISKVVLPSPGSGEK